MFENSLVESRFKPISQSNRYTALASISLQLFVAAVVIALPLLHPEALPFHLDPPKLLLPLPIKSPVTVPRVEHASSSSLSIAPPAMTPSILQSLLPGAAATSNEAPSLATIGIGMSAAGDLPHASLLDSGKPRPNVTVTRTNSPAGPVTVSSGVSQGMLVEPIRPIYPAIAKALRVEGTVVVEAVISRTGTIESMHVISGPAMLQNAALEAIRVAHYKPYRLNGQPTDVQTTITVNFRISS